METKEIIISNKKVILYLDEYTYPPLEDTLLAIDILENIKNKNNYNTIVDLCTGSGILAITAHVFFKPKLLAATDISPLALQNAKRNLKVNNVQGYTILCNCGTCLKKEWDLVIVNPPYLPQDPYYQSRDYHDSLIKAQWSLEGVLEQCCNDAARLGKEIVFVYSSLSDIDIADCLKGKGFNIVKTLKETFFMETIYAIHAVREHLNS